MNRLKIHIIILILAFGFVSCGLNENEPYNLKYIHIMMDETSATTVSCVANNIGTYTVYLSSARFTKNVEVTYKIEVGDGLQEGLDYKLITKGDKLVFLSGIFDMPIRIQWLANAKLDATKNNSIVITLLSNNQGYSIGLPGPDHNQSKFTITKTIQ